MIEALQAIVTPEQIAIGSVVSILLLALPAALSIWPQRRNLKLWLGLGGLAVVAYALEALSITTGFPYGYFTYADTVGGKVFGLVPWTVPFAWLPIVIGVAAIVHRQTKDTSKRILYGALGAVAVDLILDPGAVATGMWTFTSPGVYYNVPLTNFVGWFLSGGLAAVVLNTCLSEPPTKMALYGLLAIIAGWTLVAWYFQFWGVVFIGGMALGFLVRLVKQEEIRYHNKV